MSRLMWLLVLIVNTYLLTTGAIPSVFPIWLAINKHLYFLSLRCSEGSSLKGRHSRSPCSQSGWVPTNTCISRACAVLRRLPWKGWGIPSTFSVWLGTNKHPCFLRLSCSETPSLEWMHFLPYSQSGWLERRHCNSTLKQVLVGASHLWKTNETLQHL